MGTVGATQAQKAVGEDPALQEGIELCLDKCGQGRSSLGFDLGEEGFEVLLDQLVEDGVFGTPPLVVDASSRRRRLNRVVHHP